MRRVADFIGRRFATIATTLALVAGSLLAGSTPASASTCYITVGGHQHTYICGMAVTMVALVALWAIADAAGVIHSVEKFFGDLLQTEDFTFLDAEILRGALLVSAVLVVLQIVITVIAAAFYNVFAELFGGIELTISEDESAL